jgi:hypothetical protein
LNTHYAPRRLLRGFCEPGSDTMLWQYDQKLNRFSRVSVTSAANENAF